MAYQNFEFIQKPYSLRAIWNFRSKKIHKKKYTGTEEPCCRSLIMDFNAKIKNSVPENFPSTL